MRRRCDRLSIAGPKRRAQCPGVPLTSHNAARTTQVESKSHRNDGSEGNNCGGKCICRSERSSALNDAVTASSDDFLA